MAIYIKSAAQITIQKPLCDEWFDDPLFYNERYVRSQEPDYKEFVSPMEARRMGKVLKRAIATSITALQGYDGSTLDAIITGTGLGCIENTEKFLTAMAQNGESLLPPTYFMQSTHNTISSQVALLLKCHGYNCTYSHLGVSFDSALMDAYTQFRLGVINTALVGGHDEMTSNYFTLLEKVGYWTKDTNSGVIVENGSFSGETAASFFLSTQHDQSSWCELLAMDLLYKPDVFRLKKALIDMLQQNKMTLSDIDAVVVGLNGNEENDIVYTDFLRSLGLQIPMVAYKQLFGESFTMSAIGLYVGATIVRLRALPRGLCNVPIIPKNVLVYNHFHGKDHSLILLSQCQD